jgi:integrase
MVSDLVAGRSRESAKNRIIRLRYLFEYADENNLPLTINTVTDTFCSWAESMLRRTRRKAKSRRGKQGALSMSGAYSNAATVGFLLNTILERTSNIVELTGLRAPRQTKSATNRAAEKQNLKGTFVFGNALADICDQTAIGAIQNARFPFEVDLRTGQTVIAIGKNNSGRLSQMALLNLRIEAELEMFIAQTGMNVAQAVALKLYHFTYVPYDDDYHVKEYKKRRDGEVLFKVFKEYRPHFERYLAWRRAFFPKSNDFLFPFDGLDGTRQESRFNGHRIVKFCKAAGIAHIPPRSLRGARVNWLLRATANSALTAEMVQSTEPVVVNVYRRPSQQEATVQIIRFWKKVDPSLSKTQSVAPGGCTGTPKEAPLIPVDAPKPNCDRASGCLWCDAHRDIDSFEYVWAMTSFQRLKLLELSKVPAPKQEDGKIAPAAVVIDRIGEVLTWFKESKELRRAWVEESAVRMQEGDYHPDWQSRIQQLEGAS